MKSLFNTIIAVNCLFINISLCGQSLSEISIKKDIVYGQAGDVDLKLDIGHPEGRGPFPAVLFFHGGGWQQGDKSAGTDVSGGQRPVCFR